MFVIEPGVKRTFCLSSRKLHILFDNLLKLFKFYKINFSLSIYKESFSYNLPNLRKLIF